MSNPSFGDICWTELATPDVKKAKDFYGAMFGWQFNEIKAHDMTYTIVKGQNKEFAGIWEIPKEVSHIPPHWMTYILVEDVKIGMCQVR